MKFALSVIVMCVATLWWAFSVSWPLALAGLAINIGFFLFLAYLDTRSLRQMHDTERKAVISSLEDACK